MSAEQELKVLKDKFGRQELLVESLRKQNRELLEVVKELNEYIAVLKRHQENLSQTGLTYLG